MKHPPGSTDDLLIRISDWRNMYNLAVGRVIVQGCAMTVQKIYDAKDFDCRLKPGAAAVDRGVVVSNVTDGFRGPAPDLGAKELGQAPPHYGQHP